jgi:predicted porin
MQKKLMAAAVASALAMPGVALAQNITFSGFWKVGLENIKISQPNAARAGLHDSEMRVADNSSRMIVNSNEDLGGGLSAIGQIDFRFEPDNGAVAATGNTWVGLRSKEAGTLTFGRHDLHYGKSPSDLPNKAGSLKAAAISIMDFIDASPIAGATRTPNVIRWDSPNWGGFTVTAAYSTNPAGAEADLNTGVRKGRATNINPSFTAGNFKVEYSNWNAKPDASLADQRGDTLNAWFSQAGLKVGFAYNKSSLKNAAGTTKTERTAWNIPVNYSTGPHDIHFHYSKAGKNDVNGTEAANTGAKMMAVAYVYNVSKRTTMGITYAALTNESASTYRLFTDNGGGTGTPPSAIGGLSSANAQPAAGEDPRLLAFIVRHAF